MYFLLFVLIFFVLLTIWWFEAKYNYFHDIWTGLKKVCPWIDMQTKFKLAICKVFLVSLVLTLIICIWNVFYSPYVDQYLSFNNWKIDLAEKKNKSNPISEINQDSSLPLKIEIVNDDSQIGDWGTFGDFVGGTLNPIIGFISILLLFATWRLTSNTFKSTDSALKSQQFDSWFFNLLQGFQSINHKYSENIEKIDFYKQLFLDKKQNLALSQDILLVQYFSSLKILLKMIDKKLNFIENEKDQYELKNFYIDIIISNISDEILQILAWCSFKDKDLKKLMEENGFFRTLNFNYILGHGKHIFSNYNFEMLSNLHRYDEKIFQNSQQFLDLKKTYIYEVFFSNNVSIDQFFKKQYKEEIQFQLISVMSSDWQLSLRFEQKGLEIRSIGDSHLDPQTVNYNQMIFNTGNIQVKVEDFFEMSIPDGQLLKMKISSETAKLQNLEIK